MKILITGGSGFIGTALANFLKNNHEITIFDLNLPKVQDVAFIIGDVTKYNEILQASKNQDVIIHLAALVGVTYTEKFPIRTLDFNVYGTKNVLEACIASNAKIIFSSSSEVYGEPLKLPISEEDNPIPITTYGLSKLVAEEYIKTYSKTYGLRYEILRFFNAYGPRQAIHWVITNFVHLALNNEPITIHSDGTQIRAFCHINDIVNGISLAITHGNNEIFNIGNGNEPISIRDLAKKIISLTTTQISQVLIPFEKSNRNRIEILHRVPSTEKAKKLLNYEPRITLEKGLLDVINYLRRNK